MKSKWSIILFLLVLTKAAFAQETCAPNIACVNWNASSGWDTNPVTPFAPGTVQTYTVWLVENGQAVRALATTTQTSARIRGLPTGNRCFTVTVTVSPVPTGYNSTSLPSSPPACKVLRFPGPSDGSIEAPTDGSIEEPNN